MPVLGYETHGNRKRLARAFKDTYEGPKCREQPRRETQYTSHEALILGYQRTRSPALPHRQQVHPRQTLHRFGYSMVTSTETRDRDQVSFRWAAAMRGPRRYYRKKSFRPVIMVDQLWLWMLEDGKISSRDFSVPEAFSMLTVVATQGRSLRVALNRHPAIGIPAGFRGTS